MFIDREDLDGYASRTIRATFIDARFKPSRVKQKVSHPGFVLAVLPTGTERLDKEGIVSLTIDLDARAREDDPRGIVKIRAFEADGLLVEESLEVVARKTVAGN